jgi:CheY-like chemotaxis protein
MTGSHAPIPSEAPLIIVAEDDAAMRELLTTWFRLRGFRILPCQDGDVLLERLREIAHGAPKPALVISDVQMPGSNGLDVLHWLQKWLPDVPAILVTAFGEPHIHERARELDAVAVMDKPFDLGTLHAEVMRTLAARAN